MDYLIGRHNIDSDDDDLVEECSDFEIEEIQETTKEISSRRKNSSFVWIYFRSIGGTKSECVLCKSCVSSQVSNLARHLHFSHNITKKEEGISTSTRGRPLRSFIWKFATKVNSKQSRCNFCQKILYSGGGNTANIAKHLQRAHSNMINNEKMSDSKNSSLDIASADAEVDADNGTSKRKGASYVWQYVDRLSRNVVRCNLCQKDMNFHGTANVITHLQRKHNILGQNGVVLGQVKAETTNVLGNNSTANVKGIATEVTEDTYGEDAPIQLRRGPNAVSGVWKYCKKVSKDSAVCSFCKKILSYQGTSNLQRHLHRMHGVVVQNRNVPKDNANLENEVTTLSTDIIWKHFVTLPDETGGEEGGVCKCNLCSSTFSSCDALELSKHLILSHGISNTPCLKRPHIDSTEIYSDEEHLNHFDDDNMAGPEDWTEENSNHSKTFEHLTTKKHDSIYDDIIIEENESEQYDDEDPFDPSIINNLPMANALSPATSRAVSPDFQSSSRRPHNSPRLKQLNDERMRAETEYFREKASYYRMQKYLVAMQTKKFRREMELSTNKASNPIAASIALNSDTHNQSDIQMELPNASYTLSVLNVGGNEMV